MHSVLKVIFFYLSTDIVNGVIMAECHFFFSGLTLLKKKKSDVASISPCMHQDVKILHLSFETGIIWEVLCSPALEERRYTCWYCLSHHVVRSIIPKVSVGDTSGPSKSNLSLSIWISATAFEDESNECFHVKCKRICSVGRDQSFFVLFTSNLLSIVAV